MLQILDKMILPLGVRIKYSRETALSPTHAFWEQEQSYDLSWEFNCPTAVSSPASVATFEVQVLELREEEVAFRGTCGGAPTSPLLGRQPLRCLCTVCPEDSGLLPGPLRSEKPRVFSALRAPPVPADLPLPSCFVFETMKNKQRSLGCNVQGLQEGKGG